MKIASRCIIVSSLLSLTLIFSACGGGNPMNPNNPLTPGGTSSVVVGFGDAPADSIVSFELTITSITLTSSTGSTVTVLSSPAKIEVSHRSGTFEPLVLKNIPQGTYTSATVSFSDPEITIIDPITHLPKELITTATTSTATVQFSPSITVGATPVVLNFDLNAASSVTISGNTATVTPVFTVNNAPAAANNDDQDVDNGEIEDVTGTVTAVSGTTFTITRGVGSTTLTFDTNSSTQFRDIAGFSAIVPNLVVQVEGVTRPDGTLLATRVEGQENEAIETEGLVTQVTGSPATSFKFIPHQVATMMGTSPTMGHETTVNISAGTTFRIDNDRVDTGGLPFTPTFNASTLSKAQAVEVEVQTPATDNLTAQRVKLKPQTVGGAVSALSGSGSSSTFTLTVAADSAFASLTGQTTITVFRQGNTRVHNVTLANGNNVRVRGLLFNDGGVYKLVAGRVTNP
jgi:hypothetical protein